MQSSQQCKLLKMATLCIFYIWPDTCSTNAVLQCDHILDHIFLNSDTVDLTPSLD